MAILVETRNKSFIIESTFKIENNTSNNWVVSHHGQQMEKKKIIVLIIETKTQNNFHIITDSIIKINVIPNIITIIMVTNLSAPIIDHINEIIIIQMVKRK